MTTEQSVKTDQADREAYALAIKQKRGQIPGTRWYADNTREPIRDETLRDGLVSVGAVLREGVITTAGVPRYSPKADFAALFQSALEGEALEKAIAAFQTKHLSKGARARVSIMLSGAAGAKSSVKVMFPNGDTRQPAPGPNSVIAKAVVEDFCTRFLEAPTILWLSESGNKVVAQDDKLAARRGLKIEPDKNLPDLILADLSPDNPLLVFVEVVATNGAITDRRQKAIYELTDAAGFPRGNVAFLTAYQDRQSAGVKKTVAALAWDSFAWFVSEPANIVQMEDGANGRWGKWKMGQKPWQPLRHDERVEYGSLPKASGYDLRNGCDWSLTRRTASFHRLSLTGLSAKLAIANQICLGRFCRSRAISGVCSTLYDHC